jgi:hypothetical protein
MASLQNRPGGVPQEAESARLFIEAYEAGAGQRIPDLSDPFGLLLLHTDSTNSRQPR